MKKNYAKLLAFFMLANFVMGVSAQSPLQTSSYQSLIDGYLNEKGNDYGLSSDDLRSLFVTNDYYSESTQITHVYVNQAFEGILIHNAISSIAIKNNKVFYYANSFISDIENKVNTTTASITAEQAISNVANSFGLGSVSNLTLLNDVNDRKTFTNGNISQRNITANKVFFNKEDELKLVWDITIYAKDGSHWWRVKVDAQNSEILGINDYLLSCNFGETEHLHSEHAVLDSNLFTENVAASMLVADGSNYNVFALPVESPNHGSRSIVSNPASDLASPFGWHDTDGIVGPEHTITRGNNVWAQEDRNGNNGLGFSPDGTNTLDFDFPLDLNQPPSTYESASITNLFYQNNMMHDIWFHHGFDEPSGNFQSTNYGLFGVEGDFVFADAQDGSGLNNATFGTPPDGQNPAMSMFLWSPPGPPSDLLTVNNGSVAGNFPAVQAGFGGEIDTVGITANLSLVIDTVTADSNDNLDACNTIINAADINGTIAVIRRGNCQFGLKVLQAEQAGAVAAIVVNNDPGAPITMGAGTVGDQVTIPSVMVNQFQGEGLIAAIQAGEDMTATLVNNGPFEIDGSFDNVIIAHEYGHGISTRLTGGPFTADCLFNEEEMGEGWSDWFGLMVTMRATDTPDLARGIGT
ncbi:MAG: peptidase, partial [Psychroserpens sp.]|nr:peptidase [Psychroserpens sp.]